MNTPTPPAAASAATSDGAAGLSRAKDDSFRTSGSPIDAVRDQRTRTADCSGLGGLRSDVLASKQRHKWKPRYVGQIECIREWIRTKDTLVGHGGTGRERGKGNIIPNSTGRLLCFTNTAAAFCFFG